VHKRFLLAVTLNQAPRAKPQLCKTLQKARPRGELREAEAFLWERHFVLHTKTLLCLGILHCVFQQGRAMRSTKQSLVARIV